MTMPNDAWEFDRGCERDDEREPSRRFARTRVELNPRGTLRAAHEQARVVGFDLTARVLMRDDGVFGPCGVEYLAPKYSHASKTLRARCTACDFVGPERAAGSVTTAYDDARAHKCDGGGK